MSTKTLWQYEAEFVHLIASMKEIGIKVDRDFCRPRITKGEAICQKIREELSWNPGSTKQLGDFLLGEMGYPVVKRTEKGNPSFDKHAIEEYEEMLEADGSDIAKHILRYRGWQKVVSSNYRAYLELADKASILHPNYKVHGTVTCRTSCELPNLQQIPRESVKEWNGEVKKAFIPREGMVLVEFDYKQLETRLAAAVARELELIEAFKQGVDVFQVMADALGWDRQDAKLLTYMTLYGAGIRKVAMIFKINQSSARDMIEEFFGQYPNLRKKSKHAEMVARNQGYIEYWTGRRRHLTMDHRKAFNAWVQGGAFEIVKRSGLRLQGEIPWPLVLTVHDSYVVEMPIEDYTTANCERIKDILEAVPETPEFGVPFAVDYKRWGEMN